MGGVQVEVFADQETFEMLGKEIFEFFNGWWVLQN